MKALKIIGIILAVIGFGAGVTSIVLTIWANKPRGVKIDLNKLSY